jgi:hypothetical protein
MPSQSYQHRRTLIPNIQLPVQAQKTLKRVAVPAHSLFIVSWLLVTVGIVGYIVTYSLHTCCTSTWSALANAHDYYVQSMLSMASQGVEDEAIWLRTSCMYHFEPFYELCWNAMSIGMLVWVASQVSLGLWIHYVADPKLTQVEQQI